MKIIEIKNNIFKSSIIGIVRVVIAIPIYLILTPFVLQKLGVEDFAIWSFSTIIISLIVLSDFGFKNALIYHLAKNIKSKRKQSFYFVNATAIFSFITFVIITVTVLLSEYFASSILQVPAESVDKTSFVLITIAISFGFRFIATPYQALIESHQQIYYSHYTMIAWLITNFIFTILILNISASIYNLALASLLPNIIVYLMYYIKAKKDYKYIKFRHQYLSKKYIFDMLKYGSGIHVATIAIAMREPILKILIARNTDLVAVTIFELSYRLSIQAISIVKTPLQSVFSASALLSKDKDKLNEIIPPFCNYNIAFLIPSSVFFFIFSSQLIQLWLGTGHENTAEILPYMFLSLAIYYLTEPLYKTIEASGKSIYSAILQCIIIISSFLLYELTIQYKHYAAVYVLLASFSLFSIINIVVFNVLFKGIRTFDYLKMLFLFMLGYIFLVNLSESTIINIITFTIYLLLHFYLCKYLGIFNIYHLAKRIYLLTFKKSH